MSNRSTARDQYVSDLNRPMTDEEALECNQRGITLPQLRTEKRHAIDHEPDPDQLEDDERREIVRIYKAHGCITYNLSQPRKAKFMTPGLPDMIVCRPACNRMWMHEAKRPVGGRYSPAQLEFRGYCELCGIEWVGGDKRAAIEKLRSLGVDVDEAWRSQ